MLETLLDAAGIAMLVLGLTLATIGLYGLLRMPGIFDAAPCHGSHHRAVDHPDPDRRRRDRASAEITTSAVLVIVFVLITSPLSGHAIARAAYHTRDRQGDGEETKTNERRSASRLESRLRSRAPAPPAGPPRGRARRTPIRTTPS